MASPRSECAAARPVPQGRLRASRGSGRAVTFVAARLPWTPSVPSAISSITPPPTTISQLIEAPPRTRATMRKTARAPAAVATRARAAWRLIPTTKSVAATSTMAIAVPNAIHSAAPEPRRSPRRSATGQAPPSRTSTSCSSIPPWVRRSVVGSRFKGSDLRFLASFLRRLSASGIPGHSPRSERNRAAEDEGRLHRAGSGKARGGAEAATSPTEARAPSDDGW